MTIRGYTLLLIVIYGITILSFSLLEAGHSLFHTVKNSIHDHNHGHHHGMGDHTTVISVDDTDAPDTDSSNQISCYFLFFEKNPLALDKSSWSCRQFCGPFFIAASTVDLPQIPPPIS
jgi:hypothetical protein